MDTIYPYLFRKIATTYQRERIELADGDFLDLDWREDFQTSNLLVLCHGLEGSSKSKYMLGMADYALNRKINILSINFRSCSGEMNRLLPSYHHGEIKDLGYILNYILQKKSYQNVHLMGFSLGGNVILKYLGTLNNSVDKRIKTATAISVPTDLHSSSRALDKSINFLYTKNFRRLLKPKLELKSNMFPGVLDMTKFEQVKTWWDFDTTFTSKIFGFKNADEYYDQGSANNYIAKISIPTLIINALNDPFLDNPSFPYLLCKDHPHVHLITPKRGGHVGFTLPGKKYTWVEKMGLDFMRKNV